MLTCTFYLLTLDQICCVIVVGSVLKNRWRLNQAQCTTRLACAELPRHLRKKSHCLLSIYKVLFLNTLSGYFHRCIFNSDTCSPCAKFKIYWCSSKISPAVLSLLNPSTRSIKTHPFAALCRPLVVKRDQCFGFFAFFSHLSKINFTSQTKSGGEDISV